MLAVGEIVKPRDLDLSESSNKSLEPLLDGPSTFEHMSALLLFKFPASGKYDAILDSFVTTAPTMHVRAAKALFDVIMHKVKGRKNVCDRVHYLQKISDVKSRTFYFGRLIFGHIFSHLGEISDKDFGHFAETLLEQI